MLPLHFTDGDSSREAVSVLSIVSLIIASRKKSPMKIFAGINRTIGQPHFAKVEFPQQNNWTGQLNELEVVCNRHTGIECTGCGVNPIIGIRYKCKTCANFNYCDECFHTLRVHRHYFNSIAEEGYYIA
jgi:Zinc finger, ZZ type